MPLPTGRMLEDHKINPSNDMINVIVADAPGSGGAHHVYKIEFPDGQYDTTVSFQNGPIAEAGINGVTQEILLAIVIDRLRCFQKGPFSTKANACALTHCEEALHWLQQRTIERMRRGVEGTHQV